MVFSYQLSCSSVLVGNTSGGEMLWVDNAENSCADGDRPRGNSGADGVFDEEEGEKKVRISGRKFNVKFGCMEILIYSTFFLQQTENNHKKKKNFDFFLMKLISFFQ